MLFPQVAQTFMRNSYASKPILHTKRNKKNTQHSFQIFGWNNLLDDVVEHFFEQESQLYFWKFEEFSFLSALGFPI